MTNSLSLDLACGDLLRTQNFIGGRWTDAAAGDRFDVVNPADESRITKVADSRAADARDALEAAHAAFPGWRATPARERAQLLKRWHALIVQHQDDLGRLISREQGKPFAEGRGEVLYAASYVEWFAEEATRTYGDVIPEPVRGRKMIAVKEPIGVVAAITPWNFPAAMIARKIAPALAVGCTVVCKPAEDTPLTSLALVRLAEEAGLPAGTLNIVTASRDKRFAGGRCLAGGRTRAQDYVHRLDPGRQAPRTRIGADAEEAFARTRRQRTVHRVRRRRPRWRGRRPDGLEVPQWRTDLRVPESRLRARCRTRQVRRKAVRACRGTESRPGHGGRRPDRSDDQLARGGEDRGAPSRRGREGRAGRHRGPAGAPGRRPQLRAPAVLAGATPDMRLAQEETFGPVVAVFRFSSEEEVIGLANDTPYGLAAYFYRQRHRARMAGRRGAGKPA